METFFKDFFSNLLTIFQDAPIGLYFAQIKIFFSTIAWNCLPFLPNLFVWTIN